MKTHGWNANCAMVLRCSLYFPPYNLRDVWRADKHSYLEAVTHSLELYLSTPTSHTSKLLKGVHGGSLQQCHCPFGRSQTSGSLGRDICDVFQEQILHRVI